MLSWPNRPRRRAPRERVGWGLVSHQQKPLVAGGHKARRYAMDWRSRVAVLCQVLRNSRSKPLWFRHHALRVILVFNCPGSRFECCVGSWTRRRRGCDPTQASLVIALRAPPLVRYYPENCAGSTGRQVTSRQGGTRPAATSRPTLSPPSPPRTRPSDPL